MISPDFFRAFWCYFGYGLHFQEKLMILIPGTVTVTSWYTLHVHTRDLLKYVPEIPEQRYHDHD
jgi:hypothetical protein